MKHKKIRKFFRSPVSFFQDAVKNILSKKEPPFRKNIDQKCVVEKNVQEKLSTWINADLYNKVFNALDAGQKVFPVYALGVDPYRSLFRNGSISGCAFPSLSAATSHSSVNEFLRCIKKDPATFRNMLLTQLLPLCGSIQAIIFLTDSGVESRIVASICRDLKIPTIFIPCDGELWKASSPYAGSWTDVILGWGHEHQRLVADQKGGRIQFTPVGPVILDNIKLPALPSENFFGLFGLKINQTTLLFCMSFPESGGGSDNLLLHSYLSQIEILKKYIVNNNMQVLIMINMDLNKNYIDRISSSIFSVDGFSLIYGDYSFSDIAYYCNIVVTGRVSELLHSVHLGIPVVALEGQEISIEVLESMGIDTFPANRNDFESMIQKLFAVNFDIKVYYDIEWAGRYFSIGSFDGKAWERVINYLLEFDGSKVLPPSAPSSGESDFVSNLLGRTNLYTARFHPEKSGFCFLSKMLNSIKALPVPDGRVSVENIIADFHVQVGIKPYGDLDWYEVLQKSIGKKVLFVESGFIYSLDIALLDGRGISIVLDDRTQYYDATRISRLQLLLEHGPELTDEQSDRSIRAMALIRQGRVSKYNHAPDIPLQIGRAGRSKLLLVDQRFGDRSVTCGCANTETFKQMLLDAAARRELCDIIIKRHPDAIRGGKSSYFSNERLDSWLGSDRSHIHLIDYDINPHSLIDVIDEVYVATSGMGFEALMAGKIVHCYGAPFYAGWGVTDDKLSLPERTRYRSIGDIFHFSHIVCSRYYNPDLGKVIDIEDAIQYIIAKKDGLVEGA